MVNNDYKYADRAEAVAEAMIENLYNTTLWGLDSIEIPEDEYNEVHAEFMEQVVAIMYKAMQYNKAICTMCKR